MRVSRKIIQNLSYKVIAAPEKTNLAGTVMALSPDGSGVVRADDGKVVFVPLTVAEDEIEFRITSRKKKAFFGEVISITSPSPHRTPAPDPEFPAHGGAPWQMIAYPEQLKWKEQFVRDGFERIAKIPVPFLEPIVASPITERYRNKMEFSFGHEKVGMTILPDGSKQFCDESPGLGLHRRGNWREIVRITDTILAPREMIEVNKIIENFALASKLPVWNPFPNKGFWREAMVRFSHSTGELLIRLTVGMQTDADFFIPLAKILQEKITGFVGLVVTTYNGVSVAPPNTPSVVIAGKNSYHEHFCGLNFEVASDAFFQVNTPAAESLVASIAEFAELSGTEHVLDLFCGTGAIGLALAKKCQSVTGIELVESAVEIARTNAAQNNIHNAEFFAGAAEEILGKIAQQKHFDTAIIDPPRAGLPKKARQILAELAADKLVMVSCNPATLARDIADLQPFGWKLVRVRAHDLFPHTPHVETVALLTR